MCEEDFGSYSSELGVPEASEQGKDVPGWASAGPLWLPAESVCEGGGGSRRPGRRRLSQSRGGTTLPGCTWWQRRPETREGLLALPPPSVCSVLQLRGWQTLSAEGQTVNIFVLGGRAVSVTAQLCPCSLKAAAGGCVNKWVWL